METITNNTAKPRHYVVASAAKMPNSCWGRYVRVAVLRLEPGATARLIRDCTGVEVIATWEKCRDGSTERCAAERARRAAEELAAELNKDNVRAYVDESSTAHCFCARCWREEDREKYSRVETLPGDAEGVACEVCGKDLG